MSKLEQITIVASDLDGTLLSPNHQLSDYTKAILKKLHEQGYTFVFATGRHRLDVASIRQKAAIPAYMVTSNGANVHDQHDNLMFSQCITPHVIQPIIDLIKNDHDTIVHIYQNDKWLINKHRDHLDHFDSNISYQMFDDNNAPTNDIIKLFLVNPDHEHLIKFDELIVQSFGELVSTAFSTPWCLEIMGANVNKGTALDLVAKSINYTLDNCIAFGDGMNDVEMLSMVGKGLVMGSAPEKVKIALANNEIIGNNAEDSVAHYLQDHLL